MSFAKLTVSLLCSLLLLAEVRSRLVISKPNGVNSTTIPSMVFDGEAIAEIGSYSTTFTAKYKRDPEDEEYHLWIKISKDEDGDKILEHEWSIYNHLEAVAKLGNKAPSEASKAGIQEVYFIGVVVPESELYPGKSSRIAIIMKPLGTNLFQYSMENPVAGVVWLRINFEMMRAVNYIHSKGVIHGDIRPDKFVFNGEERKDELGINTTNVVLSGFKHAQIKRNQIPCTHHNATLYFMSTNAHEILDYNASKNANSQSAHNPPLITMGGDIEACAFSMFYTKYRCVPWDNEFKLYYHLSNTEEEPVKGSQDKESQRIKLLGQIKKAKYAFANAITDKFTYELTPKGTRLLTFPGYVLINMLYYARFTPDKENSMPKFPESQLVTQWEEGFDALRKHVQENKNKKLAQFVSSLDVPEGIPPTVADEKSVHPNTSQIPEIQNSNETPALQPKAEIGGQILHDPHIRAEILENADGVTRIVENTPIAKEAMVKTSNNSSSIDGSATNTDNAKLFNTHVISSAASPSAVARKSKFPMLARLNSSFFGGKK